MQYLLFSLLFVVVHMAAYAAAGVLAYRVSADLYQGKTRLLDFLKDMGEEDENIRVGKLVFPAQLLRAFLMSLVLYPILGPLSEISYGLRAAFLAGLMFVYTDFASAIPFPHNLEGFVYLKDRYLQHGAFWKLQFEIVIYSILFGLAASWLLFLFA